MAEEPKREDVASNEYREPVWNETHDTAGKILILAYEIYKTTSWAVRDSEYSDKQTNARKKNKAFGSDVKLMSGLTNVRWKVEDELNEDKSRSSQTTITIKGSLEEKLYEMVVVRRSLDFPVPGKPGVYSNSQINEISLLETENNPSIKERTVIRLSDELEDNIQLLKIPIPQKVNPNRLKDWIDEVIKLNKSQLVIDFGEFYKLVLHVNHLLLNPASPLKISNEPDSKVIRVAKR